MQVLVTYATRLGSTREIAERIAARLGACDVRATTAPVDAIDELDAFDAVVIGSALYAGHVLPGARDFVRDHRDELASRPVWLFSSGPVGDMAVRADPVVPGEVTRLVQSIQARGHRSFAGAFDRAAVDKATLPMIERIVAKRFIPQGDWRDWAAIDRWAEVIAGELAGIVRGGRRDGAHPVGTIG
jgi:menaquinone-dependent protoporphyrinogen oxidase